MSPRLYLSLLAFGTATVSTAKTAYVAGAMRGLPEFQFPTFHEVTRQLRGLGITVHNPAEHDEQVYPDIAEWAGYASGDIDLCPKFKFHDAMRWDLARVTESDIIVLLKGWESSSGAGHEKAVAEWCGLGIYEAELV